MAREVKIKQTNGEFKKVELFDNYKDEFKNALDLSKKNDQTIIRETREYKLITPLFGGGAETNKADEISVIRATEIRGHLRFWWRATRGRQFATIAELKKAEDAIFGSTDQHSSLQVEIELTNRGQDFADQRDNRGESHHISSIKNPYSYISFPLRGESTAKIIENIEFSVTLSYPQDFADDLKESLWAWETFGGIGARTRRGFGAIQNKNYLKDSVTVTKEIQEELEKYASSDKSHKAFPTLFNQYRITSKKPNVDLVWKFLFGKLKKFRQYRKDNDGKLSDYGKSQWSEPNALRFRTNRRDEPQIDKFPRAAFGLPILFEMYHDKFSSTLKGKDYERLSSPLILRPIKCSDGAVGIALILYAPRVPPNGLTLTDVRNDEDVSADLTITEAKILSETLEPLKNETDVLKAFLNYLEN